MSEAIERVAVIGAGVIGASWAAYFLARGFTVFVSDPDPGAEAKVRAAVARYWEVLEQVGLAAGASLSRLSCTTELEPAVEGAQFVQENGPERLDLKVELFRNLDAATPSEVLLASSSSTLAVSAMQSACSHPERVVLGHPFNPPHLIPLVEVVGGDKTSADAVERAMAFYTAIGKKPIRLRREILGHIANRLQAALWQEAFNLVEQGVASVADIDTAIAYGPGLRWALLGPFLNLHLSGGAGGITHLLEHLGPANEAMWRDLGRPVLDGALRQKVVEQVHEMIGGGDQMELERRRDELLSELIRRKRDAALLP